MDDVPIAVPEAEVVVEGACCTVLMVPNYIITNIIININIIMFAVPPVNNFPLVADMLIRIYFGASAVL